MTRDAVLNAIESVTTVPAGKVVTLSGIAHAMAEVERLSNIYMDGEGDQVYLLEALLSAQSRIRRMLVNVIGD